MLDFIRYIYLDCQTTCLKMIIEVQDIDKTNFIYNSQ